MRPLPGLWVVISLVSILGGASWETYYTAPPGVFYGTSDSIHSSSGCSSVIYYRGERVGESTLYRLDDQTWDLERAVVYSPDLDGCVQCAADRYFSLRRLESKFYGPAHCMQCGDGRVQDATGVGCMKPIESCAPPLVRNTYGNCGCPIFTELKPGNYCACADPAASTEYGYDNTIECVCPPETRQVNGQCLCPRTDQVYDSEMGWCRGCPHPLIAVSLEFAPSINAWPGRN